MLLFRIEYLNHFLFECHSVFSARFDKKNEDGELLDETELFINLIINHNLTESDIDNIDLISSSENQLQQQEMKDSGCRFEEINSMKISIIITGELNGSSYVQIPLRSSANLNIENNNKYCFLWSLLAYLHPCKICHSNRFSKYKP